MLVVVVVVVLACSGSTHREVTRRIADNEHIEASRVALPFRPVFFFFRSATVFLMTLTPFFPQIMNS
jgi:hypothetical protein